MEGKKPRILEKRNTRLCIYKNAQMIINLSCRMKVYFSFLILLISGCSSSGSHKANNLITDYIKIHTNDPDSYQVVSFSAPRMLILDEIASSDLGKFKSKGVIISHTYRSNNDYGALIINTQDLGVIQNYSSCFLSTSVISFPLPLRYATRSLTTASQPASDQRCPLRFIRACKTVRCADSIGPLEIMSFASR